MNAEKPPAPWPAAAPPWPMAYAILVKTEPSLCEVVAFYGSIFDGSAKSPISALRFISKSLRRTVVRLTPRDLRALNLELFSKPSVFDFLPLRNFLTKGNHWRLYRKLVDAVKCRTPKPHCRGRRGSGPAKSGGPGVDRRWMRCLGPRQEIISHLTGLLARPLRYIRRHISRYAPTNVP
jgi:hypothetical protein